MSIKQNFFNWFRENRNNLTGEELRWAEVVIDEFKWHDKMEYDLLHTIKTDDQANLKNWIDALDLMDGLDARIQMDKTLGFPDMTNRNDVIRAMDLKLAAYCRQRKNVTVSYDEKTKTVSIARKIYINNSYIIIRSPQLPIKFYPEVASITNDISEKQRKELKKIKYEKQKKLEEIYIEWQKRGFPWGYDGYGNRVK